MENVSLRLYARDSTANDPIAQALVNVTLVKPGGALLPVAVNLQLNNKGFDTVLNLPANGDYQISMQKTGYINKVTTINVNATMDNELVTRVCIISISIFNNERRH